jgi:hypothetical protein
VPGGAPIPLISNAYLLSTFTAAAADYASILVTWSPVDTTTSTPMNEFRLLSNRYGFSVDENDGDVLLDVTSSPPTSFLDQNVIPGAMHYYSFYILGVDTVGQPMWIRAGFTACLMPVNHSSGANLLSLLPEYARDLSDTELTQSNTTPQTVSAPPVPASGGPVTSPYSFPVQVTLTGAGVIDVVVDGIDLGMTDQFWVAGQGSVVVTYTGSITWSWVNVPVGNINPFLQQFLNVGGWTMDYLQTQYDFIFNSLNNPLTMPLDNLAQLAGELGMPFQAEIPAIAMRKAAANWSVVMKQRGSLAGIAEHISLLTGYTADVQLSPNIMLENDQSAPANPTYEPWSPSTPYMLAERVIFPTYNEWSDSETYVSGNAVDYNGVYYQFTSGSGATTTEVPPSINGTLQSGWAIIQGPFIYQCIAAITSLPGVQPSGTEDSNSTWQLVFDVNNGVTMYSPTTAYTVGQRVGLNDNEYQCIAAAAAGDAPTGVASSNEFWEPVFDTLWIPGLIGGTNTWELVYDTQTGSASAAIGSQAYSLVEGVGVHNPLNFDNDFTSKTIRGYNLSGTTQDVWVRSVSRQDSDLPVASLNGNLVPDPQLVVENGIPVPQPGPAWVPDTRYGTGDVVTFDNLNYQALRASTGITPGTTTAEWGLLGPDLAIPLMISAYTSQNMSVDANETFRITPFVEWYDAWGNFIARVFSRTTTAGTAGVPNNYVYDGFATDPVTSLAGRVTDAGDETWSVPEGGWTLNGDGSVYPAASGSSLAVVTVPSSATQAVTFTGTPSTGTDTGLVFWHQSATSYWHAGMHGLFFNNGGTFTEASAYTSACAVGDRLYVITNNSGSAITMPNSAGTLASPGVAVFRNVIGTHSSSTGNGLVALFDSSVPSAMVPTGSTSQSGIAQEAV